MNQKIFAQINTLYEKLNEKIDAQIEYEKKLQILDKEVVATKKLFKIYKKNGVDISYNGTKNLIKKKKILIQAAIYNIEEEINSIQNQINEKNVDLHFYKFLNSEMEDNEVVVEDEEQIVEDLSPNESIKIKASGEFFTCNANKEDIIAPAPFSSDDEMCQSLDDFYEPTISKENIKKYEDIEKSHEEKMRTAEQNFKNMNRTLDDLCNDALLNK